MFDEEMAIGSEMPAPEPSFLVILPENDCFHNNNHLTACALN